MRRVASIVPAIVVALFSRGGSAAELPLVDVRLRAPSNITYDATRVGHVAITVHVTVTNRDSSTIVFDPSRLRFIARGSLATYACDSTAAGDRRPLPLKSAETASMERIVTCETTLPGHHVLEARWDAAGDADPAIATAPFDIDAGSSAPIPLPSRTDLVAVVSGTHDVHPPSPPGSVRVVLALVNTTTRAVSLPAITVDITMREHDAPTACHDRRTLDPGGTLAPGRDHVVWMSLPCAVQNEGTYEVTVDAAVAGAASVRLQPHLVRSRKVDPTQQQYGGDVFIGESHGAIRPQ